MLLRLTTGLRIYLIILLVILITVIPGLAFGEYVGVLNLSGKIVKTSVNLEINGQMIAHAAGAQIIDGRSMVPLKTITESLGIPTTWFDSSQIIRIDDVSGPIFLKIGDPKAQVSGRSVELDMPPMIEGGQTLVPLKFLAEALQAQIEWLPDQNLVRVSRSTLQGVTFERYSDRTRVIFDVTAPEAYKIFTLREPDRLVIDFFGAGYPDKSSVTSINSDFVSTLRISQFQVEPMQARAVLDLLTPEINYQVHAMTAQQKLVIDITKKVPKDPNSAVEEDQTGRPKAPLPAPDSKVLMNKIIVLDPGHGGKNSGALGVSGLWESEVNYDIAVRVNELLQGTGAYVIMTRKADQDPGLYERAEIANTNRADIFVSIHADAHPKKETRGTTAYGHPNASKEAWALAWYVHNEIVKLTGLESKGLRTANFVVIREPQMPSILIETAYLTNVDDEALLKDPNFRQSVAQAIYNGIIIYFENKK